MDGDGNDHHPEVVLAPETCEVIVSYAPERKAPGEAFLSSSGMEMTGANAGCTRLYLRPLSCCSSPLPAPDQGMWATKAGQGENRPRRHTFDPAGRIGPGDQFIAGQGRESIRSCYSDQYGCSKTLLPKDA